MLLYRNLLQENVNAVQIAQQFPIFILILNQNRQQLGRVQFIRIKRTFELFYLYKHFTSKEFTLENLRLFNVTLILFKSQSNSPCLDESKLNVGFTSMMFSTMPRTLLTASASSLFFSSNRSKFATSNDII